ncbi:uncharacterized protein LOC131693274 [Topomyia yanbarensis]|uniref:uncharacterized protein LOC131693274 n=1 Tax=Topomyia yanbarensis TaxID=2498891 RepID=UPI00273C601B|nr:uncharacterized protein LOC131693274 [Topomyia yanbarensis]
MWSKSFNCRKQYLMNKIQTKQLLALFEHYKSKHGYQLLDIDFNLKGIGSTNGSEKLESLKAGLITYISKKGLDPSVDGFISLLIDSNASDDSKLCALLLGLHTVLSPIAAGLHFKPTIVVAQDDTILFVESVEDIRSKIQAVYASYAERHLPVAPKLVFLGSGYKQVTGRFFVCYDDVILYELPSASRALDVLVKLTAVFDLPYAKLSKLLWHFLSSYVYGIEKRETYANISKLTAYLNNLGTKC